MCKHYESWNVEWQVEFLFCILISIYLLWNIICSQVLRNLVQLSHLNLMALVQIPNCIGPNVQLQFAKFSRHILATYKKHQLRLCITYMCTVHHSWNSQGDSVLVLTLFNLKGNSKSNDWYKRSSSLRILKNDLVLVIFCKGKKQWASNSLISLYLWFSQGLACAVVCRPVRCVQELVTIVWVTRCSFFLLVVRAI